jgi:hypothetical protein
LRANLRPLSLAPRWISGRLWQTQPSGHAEDMKDVKLFVEGYYVIEIGLSGGPDRHIAHRSPPA